MSRPLRHQPPQCETSNRDNPWQLLTCPRCLDRRANAKSRYRYKQVQYLRRIWIASHLTFPFHRDPRYPWSHYVAQAKQWSRSQIPRRTRPL